MLSQKFQEVKGTRFMVKSLAIHYLMSISNSFTLSRALLFFLREMQVDHPYYPRNLILAHFVPQNFTVLEILVPFFSAVVGLLVSGLIISANKEYSLSNKQSGTRATFLWFLTCGFIHTCVEGYFAYYHADIAGRSAFMADLWKEYAKSDSRYMSSDPFVVLMESVTAFVWGPLSFFVAYLIHNDSPSRHFWQIIISLGQLYGDVLYYTTTLVEGSKHCDPHPYYFYFYFVFMNFFWIVIPTTILVTSGTQICKALRSQQQIERKVKSE
jgi:cholestenol delta-isomerase